MNYMLMIYGEESVWSSMNEEEQRQCYADHAAFGEALTAAGVLRGGAELKPSDGAKTLRFSDGKPVITDGPFAETKEQLGGYYLIEVDGLDQALEWAAKIPCMSSGSVEVRALNEQDC